MHNPRDQPALGSIVGAHRPVEHAQLPNAKPKPRRSAGESLHVCVRGAGGDRFEAAAGATPILAVEAPKVALCAP